MNVRYVFCSFLALAFLLAPEKSHARWMNANTGRFLTMDSYEGEQSQPLSLHKYLYAHGNSVNMVDPSGHFVEGNVGGLISATSLQFGLRGSQGSTIAVPGHIAARGFMKWAWLAGGIGAGAQTLMQDTQLGMEIQLAVKSNPTESDNAYRVYRCVEFADDAAVAFRRRGKQPQRITYRSRRLRTVGDNIMAVSGFGFFGGANISYSALHVGILVDGRVYDNNVPFGVTRAAWEEGYEVTSFPEFKVMTIGYAARPEVGIGDIDPR